MNFSKNMNPENKKIVSVYKPIGTSPVELINLFKEKFPEYKDEKISYAGRLDPLAHGVMILLVGEENKRRREHEKSGKEYNFQAVLGYETDSYDICGIPSPSSTLKQYNYEEISAALHSFKGKSTQKFPPFSSYAIKGKPLFKWARDNKLHEIVIPEKEIEVYDIRLVDVKRMTGVDLYKEILERINTLNGDFRQEKILEEWIKVINMEQSYQVLSAQASVSAGTYIRGIVHDLGLKLGTNATIIEIYRPKSGTYGIEDTIRI